MPEVRDPQSLSEWVGYFLFHDRATLSASHMAVLVAVGYQFRGAVERLRRRVKDRQDADAGSA